MVIVTSARGLTSSGNMDCVLTAQKGSHLELIEDHLLHMDSVSCFSPGVRQHVSNVNFFGKLLPDLDLTASVKAHLD